MRQTIFFATGWIVGYGLGLIVGIKMVETAIRKRRG